MTRRSAIPQLVRASGTELLPADHVELTARRLGITTAAAAVVYLVYIVLYRTLWIAMDTLVGFLGGIVGFMVSAAAAAYLLSGTRPAARVTLVAVAYEIFLSFILTLSEAESVSFTTASAQVPWSSVVIVLFPLLIPAAPSTIMAAALASAAMAPLGIALSLGVSGRSWPDTAVIASFVLPPFACALLAWAPTSALYRLRVAVQHARRLGNYELSERLGEGGMGEVWRANHRLLARPAAVKLIKPEMLGAKDAQSREPSIRRFEKKRHRRLPAWTLPTPWSSTTSECPRMARSST